MKSWPEKNTIEMYSRHKEGKSVIAERFIRTRKNEIYKYMTSVSKNVYIDKLDDIVNKYSNKYHNTTKLKSVHEKPSIYIVSSKEILNLKLVILLEYQNIKTFLQRLCSKLVWRSFCD